LGLTPSFDDLNCYLGVYLSSSSCFYGLFTAPIVFTDLGEETWVNLC